MAFGGASGFIAFVARACGCNGGNGGHGWLVEPLCGDEVGVEDTA